MCLLWILASAALAVIDFRLGGIALAACPLALAVLRALPSPWGDIWVNRARGTDMLRMQERRRMHRHQIGARIERPGDRRVVTWADEFDLESELAIGRGRGVFAEAGPDDEHLHLTSSL